MASGGLRISQHMIRISLKSIRKGGRAIWDNQYKIDDCKTVDAF